jgi:chemotaxis protein MotA
LHDTLALDLTISQQHNLRSANIFESMGGYSPTIGILGAVLGLIHAMNNLTDPTLLGQGIATAFIATIYGVGFANLLYIPIANKIRAIVDQQTMYREMMCEGLLSIANGDNPKSIENKLSAFKLQ